MSEHLADSGTSPESIRTSGEMERMMSDNEFEEMYQKGDLVWVDPDGREWVPSHTHDSLTEKVERFPMQNGPPITMKTARIVYAIYSSLYGTDQSLKRLGERGGFGWAEVEAITKEFIKRRGRVTYDALLESERRG